MGSRGHTAWNIRHRPEFEHSSDFATSTIHAPLLSIMGAGTPYFADSACRLQLMNITLQCQYYGAGRSKRTSILIWLGICLLAGGFEAGMVFAIRVSPVSPRYVGVEHALHFFAARIQRWPW
jgi:hypothetical protein